MTTTADLPQLSSDVKTPSTPLALIVLLAVSLLMFIPFIGRRDVVTSHEARVIQTARLMASVGWPWEARFVDVPDVAFKTINGDTQLASRLDAPPLHVNPWMVPVLNGRIRLEKPPLPYWCAATMFRLFGYGEGFARLPCGILGALATLLIFDLARRLLGNLGAWCAAGVWLSSHFVFDEYRKCMADPYLAVFTLVCVWAWISVMMPTPNRGVGASPTFSRGEHEGEAPSPRSIWLMLAFYVSLSLGALAKGPVILAHVAIALAAFHFCYGWKLRAAWWTHVIGALIFLAIALPWPLYVMRHVPHAMDLWRHESVGEFGENIENVRPWWFYFPNLLLVALPWTPLLFVHAVAPRRSHREWFPLIWYAVIVIFFSFANIKKNAYLLPMIPAQTLMITYACVALIESIRHPDTRKPPASLFAMGQAQIGIGFAVALFVLIPMAVRHATPYLAAAGVALAAAIVPLVRVWRRQPLRWMRDQVIAYALVLFAFINFYVAPTENQRSPRGVCAAAQSVLRAGDDTLFTSALPPEASVYLPLDLPQGSDPRRLLAILDTGRKERPIDQPALELLTGAAIERMEQIPVNGTMKGRWKLFRLTLRSPATSQPHSA